MARYFYHNYFAYFGSCYSLLNKMPSKIKQIVKSKFFLSLVSIIAIVVFIGGSFYIGYQEGTKNPKVVVIEGVNSAESKEKSVDFELFWDAWQIVKDKYIEGDKITNQQLLYGAISGLLSSTGDPHSVFFPPTDAKKFTQEISGQFGGIGAELGIKSEQLIIVAPLKDTPADKAGLRAGDKILKIGDTITMGFTVDDAVKLIRGEPGTKVTLTIFRDSWQQPKDIIITRAIIQVPTIDSKFIDLKPNSREKIMYLRLYSFNENAPYLFYQEALKAVFYDTKGIVLDLRDNPGGYLEVSNAIAGWFLDKGQVVVKEKFRSGETQEVKSAGGGFFNKIPVVVLINQGSASASEILAGALRDVRGIKLVGKKSFGKGSVQEIETLKDGSLIKITFAHWLTPNGTVIEKNGLKPDYEVDLTDDDIRAEKDPQFDKAIEVLKALINE